MLFSRFRRAAFAAGLLIAMNPWLSAQSQNPPAPPSPAQDQQEPASEEPLQTFKAEVNVVNLFFNVKDKHGMLIAGLTKADFQVVEDGKPQTIKYFSADSNQPLTLGILIDTSPSQMHVLGIEQESCAEFLHSVLRPKDLAFLINFDSDIDLDQDFTNNASQLARALNKLEINGGALRRRPARAWAAARFPTRIRAAPRCTMPFSWAPTRS